MKKIKMKPKWLRHEALHTTFVLLQTVTANIQEHQYYQSKINPKFNQAIDAAVVALSDAYCAVGEGKRNEIQKKIEVG